MLKRIIKALFSLIIVFAAFILCSAASMYYFKSFDKEVGFGKEYIGMDYSEVIHKFGNEPDLIERFQMDKPDEEFKFVFGSFIDSCNSKDQVIKFTYKGLVHNVTFWAYDNNETIKILLVR